MKLSNLALSQLKAHLGCFVDGIIREKQILNYELPYVP